MSAARAARDDVEFRAFLSDDDVVDVLDRLAPEVETGLDREDVA
jgi:hypothetical protein